MKRQWILRLAVAVGMALLALAPGFGDDKNVTNAKKPATDAKTPAANAGKPATDAAKVSTKKDRQILNTTRPIANTNTATTAKPASQARPAAIAKPAPKLNTAAKLKPVSNAKPASSTKAIADVKPATIVKPVAKAKPVTDSKPAVTAKLAPPNSKPASKSKPVTNSHAVADAKLVANTKVTRKAQPVVNNKLVADAKLATSSGTTRPLVVKQHLVNKPIVTASAKTMVTKPAQNGHAVSFQLPADYEQLNLTSHQRDKAVAIIDKYAGQIRNLESLLNDMKAGREKELSALLTLQQQTQRAKLKGENQAKSSTNTEPTHSAAATGPAKSAANKATLGKRDNAHASAAPILNDKLAKKAHGAK